MRRADICVVPAVLLVLLSACADKRESIVHEQMQQEVTTGSGGGLSLSSLRKTNGYEQDLGGLRLYTFEWEARIAVHADAWKAGWSDFKVLAAKPNALESAVFGVTPRRLTKGATVVLLGESQLRKTEQGWRVLGFTVKAFKSEPSREISADSKPAGNANPAVTFEEGPEGELPHAVNDRSASTERIASAERVTIGNSAKSNASVSAANTGLRTFRGAWFEVSTPPKFSVIPSIKSATAADGYDSAFFRSPDKQVEFYIYSPQWSGAPTDIAVRPSTEKQGPSESKTSKANVVTWFTITATDGSYTRTYQDTKARDGSTRWVVGIKYSSQDAFNAYKNDYVRFKKSLIQFAD